MQEQRRYVRKRKALGQHFLTDRSVLKKIVRCINPQDEDIIIEIGSGKGVLTFPLCQKAGKVIAVEKDYSLVSGLKTKAPENLLIINEDILRISFQSLTGGKQVKLAGNLPYVISSPLLFKVLKEKDLFTRCVFLLQKEVAMRISSAPGSKSFAPLSILFQNSFSVSLHSTVPPKAFSPPPKVHSAIVILEKRDQPLHQISDENRFMAFLKILFRHRRKKIINNLKSFGLSLEKIQETCQHCGIREEMRPEQIFPAQYICLFDSLDEVLRYESASQARCFTTRDYEEGVKAVLARRKPLFKGE